VLKKYKEIASELRDEIYFVYSGITERIQAKLAEYSFVYDIHLPTLRILDTAKNNTKYKYEGNVEEMTQESVL